MTSRRLGEATGHSSVLESFFVSWLTGEGPFSVHQRELFLCAVWRIKLFPNTKEQVKEISLISEGQHNSVLRRLGILWVQVYKNLPISAGGGGEGGGPRKGADHRVLPPEPDWSARAPPAPATLGNPAGRPLPAPECTAWRVTRSGGSQRDRYGPAPLSSFLGVSGSSDRPLAPLSAFHLVLTGTARAGAGRRWPRSLEGGCARPGSLRPKAASRAGGGCCLAGLSQDGRPE